MLDLLWWKNATGTAGLTAKGDDLSSDLADLEKADGRMDRAADVQIMFIVKEVQGSGRDCACDN